MCEKKQSTLDRIMAEGKKEFLDKGFKDASLRNIVKSAGVTTGAFYGYFPDKKALFEALVDPAVKGFKEQFIAVHKAFEQLPRDVKMRVAYDDSSPHQKELITYIYDHFDAFKLLISCAEGTAYADFINSLVETEVAATLDFIRDTGCNALISGRASPEMLHILSSAYFAAVFEIVVHDMPKSAADNYIENIRIFFTAGWKSILYL